MDNSRLVGLAQTIKAEAHRLGFIMAGITSAAPPPHYPVFEYWLAARRHGEMSYLASERSRQRRADPRQILPDCRSILVLGVRYPAPDSIPFPPGEAGRVPTGRVAAYAWGADYHGLLGGRLRALVNSIESQAGRAVPNRWYTDTGPLLERDLAQRAGLGWIGKNTCLIHPRLGSYFILAEILLGLELEPDVPFMADRCGSCTACLAACPTGCILPDRTLDARRCISYLTIELKGEIPGDLRPRMGEWVFGCDICQQVCPWNQRWAVSPGDPALVARPGVPHPDLVQELSLTMEAFTQKFRGSPIQRTHRRGYLRNVAVALGNSGCPSARSALERAAQADPEPLVRAHATWAHDLLAKRADRLG